MFFLLPSFVFWYSQCLKCLFRVMIENRSRLDWMIWRMLYVLWINVGFKKENIERRRLNRIVSLYCTIQDSYRYVVHPYPRYFYITAANGLVVEAYKVQKKYLVSPFFVYYLCHRLRISIRNISIWLNTHIEQSWRSRYTSLAKTTSWSQRISGTTVDTRKGRADCQQINREIYSCMQ